MRVCCLLLPLVGSAVGDGDLGVGSLMAPLGLDCRLGTGLFLGVGVLELVVESWVGLAHNNWTLKIGDSLNYVIVGLLLKIDWLINLFIGFYVPVQLICVYVETTLNQMPTANFIRVTVRSYTHDKAN